MVEARGTFDEAKRVALYRRFSEILHEEQPYTMLFIRYHLSLVSKRYGGIYSTPYGIIRFGELYVRKDARQDARQDAAVDPIGGSAGGAVAPPSKAKAP